MQCSAALGCSSESSRATLAVPWPRSVTRCGNRVQRGRVRGVGAAVIRGSSPAGSGAEEAEGWKRRGSTSELGLGLAGAPTPSLHFCRIQRGLCPCYSRQGRYQGGGFSWLPVLSARERDYAWPGSCSPSPSLGKAQEYSQSNSKSLSPARRHCCRAHLLRSSWVNLRGQPVRHAEGPLRGGASAPQGRLRFHSALARLARTSANRFFFFFPSLPG